MEDDNWEFQAIHDARCCDLCDRYDWSIWTTTEIKRFFPYAMILPLLIYPNVHPNCRCALALIETTPELITALPPEVTVPEVTPPEIYLEKPLTQKDIDKVLKAIKLPSPQIAPETVWIGERLLRRKPKRSKQG